MALVKLAPAVEAIHGHVGTMLFKRWDGQQIVGRMPDRTGYVPTANQTAQMDKFRLATLYGKAAMADPEAKALYSDVAKGRDLPVFALMVADFLNPPAIDEVDLSGYTGQIGEPIRARVSDDLQVTAVSVVIRSQVGEVLEQGAAVKGADGLTWTYTTTTALQVGQAVSIEVTGTDKPGNTTTKTTERA